MEAAEILQRQLDAANRKIEDLEKDNAKQRDELREAKAERDTAQGKVSELQKQVPAEGSLVLSGAKRAAFEEYETMGKPDDLRAQLEAKSSAEQRLSEMERREVIRTAGYSPKALERLIGSSNVKVTGEGDERKVLLVEGEEEKDLEAWAEAEGISTLLNAARLEPSEPKSEGVRALGQAGRRENRSPNSWAEASDSRFGPPKPTSN